MDTPWQGESWQKALAEAVRDPAELLDRLELPTRLLPAAQRAAAQFPLRVPESYLQRIARANPSDPLLRQILPIAAEFSEAQPGFSNDPVGDLTANPVPGLIHKYHGRALLITTGACAIHCRYCFRRHFPYTEDSSTPTRLRTIVDYLQADPSVEELILSGGDPLSLGNSRLQSLSKQLEAIPHLKRFRLHTRLPVVLPERVDNGLLNWLDALPWQTVMVIHCNHPHEIDAEVRQVLRQLADAGLTLLNQAVLLRGVNDSLETLTALSETLFAAGVMPYYLHQLDRVSGARHFEIPDQVAIDLITRLAHQLPGYLVPRLVRETAGEPAKSPLYGNPL